jgi:DNA-binding beta-propeller fold protein YncE
MSRFLLVLCVGLMFVPHASPDTVYLPFPHPIIAPFNTDNWQLEASIAAPGGDTFVLSADGKTFYTARLATANRTQGPGLVLAIDRQTGKTLHSYTTQYPVLGGLAVLPDQSQIYVGTCASFSLGACSPGYVEVFDVATGNELAAFSLGGDRVTGLASAPNGATVYVTHDYESICLGCLSRFQSLPAPPASQSASAPASTVPPSNSLTAIDVASLQVGASVGLINSQSPLAVAITQDSLLAWF